MQAYNNFRFMYAIVHMPEIKIFEIYNISDTLIHLISLNVY